MMKPIHDCRAMAVALGLLGSSALLLSGPVLAQVQPFCGVTTTGVYGLTSDNILFLISRGTTRAQRISGIEGNLISIDFRPSDGANHQLYGLTDSGQLYKFPADPFGQQLPTLVSTLAPSFTSATADFNPLNRVAANSLRVMSSDGRSVQVVDGAGPLDTLQERKPMFYDEDGNGGSTRLSITGAAYNNNLPGAQFTRLYVLEHRMDALMYETTTSTSSEVYSLGRITIFDGRLPIDFAPRSGMDIVTHMGSQGPTNTAFIVSGQRMYCVSNVGVFDQRVPQLRGTEPLVATDVDVPPNMALTGEFTDVAVIPVDGGSNIVPLK